MSSVSRSDNGKRPFSEIRLGKTKEAAGTDTFSIIVGEALLPVHVYSRNGRH